jgi:hypothetical protein
MIDESKLKNLPSIQGITGDRIETNSTGRLSTVSGVALVAPKANANLLSLMEMVKYNDGSFKGDKHTLVVLDGKGNEILRGINRGDDFWSCSDKDLISTSSVSAYPSGVDDIGMPNDSTLHLTAEERQRAKQAHELCARLRHPGDHSVIMALDGGIFANNHLTSQDFRNGRKLFGACTACTEAKMKAPREPSSTTEPARSVGQRLHMDLIILKSTSIGQNNFILVAVDEKSTYVVGVPTKTKSAKELENAAQEIIIEFNRYGHKVSQLITDDEKCLATLRSPLGKLGVIVQPTPAGLHEKKVERFIQTIKARKRAMLASLSYELPANLECESYMDAINWLNRLPNTSTAATQTPFQLVTGSKSFLPKFYFGQVGLFYSGDKESRSDWGLFAGYGPTAKYLRAYIPTRKLIYSRRRFIPQATVPAEWNFKNRIRAPDSVVRPTPPTQSPITLNQPVQFDAMTPAPHDAPSIDISPTPTVPSTSSTTILPTTPYPLSTQRIENTARVLDPDATCTADYSPEHISERALADSSVKGVMIPNEVTDAAPVMTNLDNQNKATRETTPTKKQSTTTNELDPRTRMDGRPSRSATNKTWKDGPVLSRKYSNYANAHVKKTLCQPQSLVSVIAMKTNLKTALKDDKRRPHIIKSIEAEIDNLEAPGVLKPIAYRDIPRAYLQHVIDVYMFHKEKFKADGQFDKDKCRLVLLSNLRDPDTIGETLCPTVNPISVMTQLNLAAATPGTEISVYDVKGAFLNTPMEPGKRMFIRVNRDVAKYWMTRYPERKHLIHENGCLYFELKRYVYGLHEASHQFNSLLDKKIKNLGFMPSKADSCLYTKKTSEGTMILAVHVDDMLLTSPNKRLQKWFEKELGKDLELMTQHNEVSYLGMTIKKLPDGSVTLSQHGYLSNILKKYGCENVRKPPATPATDALTESNPDSPHVEQTSYLSLVMTLMYLARFTRPDILMPVSYLATKCNSPTEEDQAKLMRVVRYLAGTKTEGLLYDSKKKFRPSISADASHHLHASGHGQHGMTIDNGSAPVGYRSAKITMMTRSSSESELFSLEDASTYALWYKILLHDMGFEHKGPIKIYQDNKSTIIMAMQGASFKRTKHLIGKETYVKERIQNGDIALQYLPTKEMPADLLTKPVGREALLRLKRILHLKPLV